MHFSIPDIQECIDKNGKKFTVYSIYINGCFHCTVRYRQLYCLHQQLSHALGSSILPQFPPKKLFPLNSIQAEERRVSLEKYILKLSQNERVLSCNIFKLFMVWAQHESQNSGKENEEVPTDVFLMNGQKITIKASPVLQTCYLLERVCSHLGLSEDLTFYFGLFIAKKEERSFCIIKHLQDFESPYLSMKLLQEGSIIVLRKNYWEISYDDIVMQDKVGLNILYIQSVSDVERGWIIADWEMQHQLASLQVKGAKREYLELVRSLKYYGYVHFLPCFCDFPNPSTQVAIAAGNKELNIRIQSSNGNTSEGNFHVTRIRCWRISTLLLEEQMGVSTSQPVDCRSNSAVNLQLAFEYLMKENEMRWVKVHSSQAALMSICLQGMVQQILNSNQKDHLKKLCRNRKQRSIVYMRRDGSSIHITANSHGESSPGSTNGFAIGELSLRKLSEKFSDFSFLEISRPSNSESTEPSSSSTVENNAFDVIGDECL